jgi:hypothetical protein
MRGDATQAMRAHWKVPEDSPHELEISPGLQQWGPLDFIWDRLWNLKRVLPIPPTGRSCDGNRRAKCQLKEGGRVSLCIAGPPHLRYFLNYEAAKLY